MSSTAINATKPENTENTFASIGDIIAAATRGESVHILCLDTETTGVGDDDRITQFSATMLTLSSAHDVRSLMSDGIEAVVSERYDRFCNPGIPVSDDAVKVTGITNDMLAGLESFHDGILADAQRLVDSADLIIGHNVGFDIKKLRHDGVTIPSDKLTSDTMFDFRDMCRYRWGMVRPEKNLTAAVSLFGYSFDAHNSANDVTATLFLFSQLIRADECCAKAADDVVIQHEEHSRRVRSYLRRFVRNEELSAAA